jgi:integrase
VAPGRRKKHSHLPTRVYEKHNGLHYVHPVTGKWHHIGPKDMPLPEILRWMANMLEPPRTDTVAGLIDRYSREVLPKKAARTAGSQRLELARLAAVFGHMRPMDVQPSDCWGYYTHRGSGSAAHHEVRLLSHVFTWARRWGVVTINPARGLGLKTPKPRDRYVTDEEFLAMRAIVPAMIGYAMDLALLTALRQGDILALERRNLTDSGLAVDTSKTGKGLLFPWAPELRLTVDAILRERPQVRRALICRRDGKRMSSSGFQSIWQRAIERYVAAGGTRYTFNDLRAKSISDTESLQEASKRAGHSDPKITARVYRRLPERVTTLAILDSNVLKLDRT